MYDLTIKKYNSKFSLFLLLNRLSFNRKYGCNAADKRVYSSPSLAVSFEL